MQQHREEEPSSNKREPRSKEFVICLLNKGIKIGFLRKAVGNLGNG